MSSGRGRSPCDTGPREFRLDVICPHRASVLGRPPACRHRNEDRPRRDAGRGVARCRASVGAALRTSLRCVVHRHPVPAQASAGTRRGALSRLGRVARRRHPTLDNRRLRHNAAGLGDDTHYVAAQHRPLAAAVCWDPSGTVEYAVQLLAEVRAVCRPRALAIVSWPVRLARLRGRLHGRRGFRFRFLNQRRTRAQRAGLFRRVWPRGASGCTLLGAAAWTRSAPSRDDFLSSLRCDPRLHGAIALHLPASRRTVPGRWAPR